MHYKVTTQYARCAEKMIAEFCSSEDATLFLTKKISADQLLTKKKIYRLYRDSELLKEHNSERISVSCTLYTEDNDFIKPLLFLFQVTRQDIDSIEKQTIANFTDANDANLFIIVKCETDNTVNDALFCVFKDHVLINSLNKNMIANQKIASDDSKDKQSMATFYPTPTPTRPIPPGGPRNCWIEPEDDSSTK